MFMRRIVLWLSCLFVCLFVVCFFICFAVKPFVDNNAAFIRFSFGVFLCVRFVVLFLGLAFYFFISFLRQFFSPPISHIRERH